MRSDIFLHFLNRDGRQIHGLFQDLNPDRHALIIARAINAAAMLCESHCFAPPGFLLECSIAQSVVETKHAFLEDQLIALPMRESSLSDFAEKKRREYSQVRQLYENLFSDERIRFLAAHATNLVPREVAIGRSAVGLWEAGPDDKGLSGWSAVKAIVSTRSLELARRVPRQLIDSGAALTWFGMKPFLPIDVVAAELEVRRVLQRNYFSLYSNEFPVVVLRNVPRLYDHFCLPSDPRIYNYGWFKVCLEELYLERLLDVDAETILSLRRRSGFIRFIDAYAGLCRTCRTYLDLRFNIDRLMRRGGFDWRKFSVQVWRGDHLHQPSMSEENITELTTALGDLAAQIEVEYSLLSRVGTSRSRTPLREKSRDRIVLHARRSAIVALGRLKPEQATSTKEDITMEALDDGDSASASVAFFIIPTLRLQNATTIGVALHGLQLVLRGLLTHSNIRVLSASTGGILVILDGHQPLFIHQLIARAVAALKSRHIPVRIGVARGDVEMMRDVDDTLNVIGPAVNRAARLACASTNEGCLFDKAYFDFSQTRIGELDQLDPSSGERTTIQGKKHDGLIECWNAPALNVLPGFNGGLHPDRAVTLESLTGAVLSYDLPRFSAGDASTLRSRFRSVRDTLRQLRRHHRLDTFALAPGGDGGWLFFPVDEVHKHRGYGFAESIIGALAVENDNKSVSAGALSRVSLHYGPVILYEDAEGASRPTGPTCFIADALAEGTDEGAGLVISSEFANIPTFGSRERFQVEYRTLPDILVNGISVKRYQRAGSQ
jgi:hypothetical protein